MLFVIHVPTSPGPVLIPNRVDPTTPPAFFDFAVQYGKHSRESVLQGSLVYSQRPSESQNSPRGNEDVANERKCNRTRRYPNEKCSAETERCIFRHLLEMGGRTSRT
jgi:hypothetical protein